MVRAAVVVADELMPLPPRFRAREEARSIASSWHSVIAHASHSSVWIRTRNSGLLPSSSAAAIGASMSALTL
jgi:hypothetical protein